MRKLYFYLSLSICLIFLTKLALAQDLNIDLSNVGNWIGEFLGIPRQLMTTDKVFRYVMLPFLAVFIAVLGIMRDIMLFRRSRHLDWILALIISFIILPWSGVMGWLILLLYGTSGVLSVTAVGLLIGIGAVMWFMGGVRRLKFNEIDLVKGQVDRIQRLRDDVKNIRVEIMNEMNKKPGKNGKGGPNWNRIEKLKKQEDLLYGEIKDREHHI